MTALFSAIPMSKGGRLLNVKSLLKGDRESARDVVSSRRKSKAEVDDDDLQGLNDELSTLSSVFPEVQPEVFREMLMNLSEQSRVEVIAELVLKDKDKWIRGRYKGLPGKSKLVRESIDKRSSVPTTDTFRSKVYRRAVKEAFYQEFKGLSHSSINAVLAEQNHDYTLSRQVLMQLSSKSWRYYITNLWIKRKASSLDSGDHPMVDWRPDPAAAGRLIPCVRRTESVELDDEVHRTLVAPALAKVREEALQADYVLAMETNEAEAADAGALYDCECCFVPYAFEELSACTDAGHYICFRCIRHAVNESLYGQGWMRNIDGQQTSVRCLAPADEVCHGHIPSVVAKRAVELDADGERTWASVEDKIARDALLISQLPVQSCPFCPYAEVDEPEKCQMKGLVTFTMLRRGPVKQLPPTLAAVLLMLVYPFVLLVFTLLTKLMTHLYSTLGTEYSNSQARVLRRRRGLRFTCQSSSCGAQSCSLCNARWHDPHVCNETPYASLRHAIEAATTLSVKRTCPKCQLSFVKSSGCNKLVCNCGYAMCYVCRREIGKESYSHFCQHFRDRGGRCTECDRCDLYVVEDEEIAIRRAAEQAEKEWRKNEARKTVDDMSKFMPARALNGSRGKDRFGAVAEEIITGKKKDRRWDWEAVFDVVLDTLLE